LLTPVFAAAEDAKPAKKAASAPVGFDDAKLRGDLPAEAPFLDPASILKEKSSPRGEVPREQACSQVVAAGAGSGA
jgi:hypothetical protein